MGIKVLALISLLVVSAYGQDNAVVEDAIINNEVEDNVSDTTVVVPVTEPTEDLIEETAPVEILSAADELQVRSGKYQTLNDGLEAEEPIPGDSVDVNINNDILLSERQLLPPASTINTNNEYDHIDGRVRPDTSYQNNGQPYVITPARLAQIRGNFMYWFYDQGGSDNLGDYQRDIHTSTPQIHKNFNFQLPFFGFRFNYTRLSMNGYIYFSDPPDHYTYPLSFPVKDWPDVNDPSFIGIFFSKCRIGSQRQEDPDQRRPGVYFRMDRDLQGNAWLRFHPLPKVSGESLRSVVFRCIFCQLGLFTVLILWSIVWVFVIQSFEGPNEIIVTRNYENEQNQLVIELATELRQITPLSPKWKRAIARRLQDEKQLTIQAVSQGARIHPGQYWDLSGTFLFVVYVMTALGFGAPVPQTLWGRSAALIYAFFAIPTHIYLMLNSSMCFVVHVERYMIRLKSKLRDKRPFVLGKTAVQNGTGSPNCSRSSEVLKSPNRSGVATKIMRLICVLGACRSVPLAAVLYYLFGVAAFGFARGSSYMDALLFPLEFTTSGGLNQVKGYARILYGFYVEGAMFLVSCGLATLRRHTGAAITTMIEKYRLFAGE